MPRSDGTIYIDTKIDQSGFEKGASALSKKGQAVGRTLTMGLTLPILAIGGAAITASVEFNKGMANVGSLIPGNTARVVELKETVQEMAVEFGKSTTDLSDGLYQVISAFGDTADTAAILEQNVRAATAGVATTTDAINLTSAVTKAYGDTSKEAVTKVSDLALLTVRLGQTTFPELAASIGRVTPLTNELGVSQEELFATMATLTGVTGSAAEVSTQLRGAMQALMAPTDAAAEAIKKSGYESGQALVEQEGMAGAIQFLTDAAKKSGLPLQNFIGSIEGQTVALALTGSQADTYTQKLGEMEQAAGATDDAFKEQTEGINEAGFAFAQAQAKAQTMAQDLGDGLAPAILDVLEALEPLLDEVIKLAQAFSEADAETQKQILTQIAFVAALGPAILLVSKLAAGMSMISAGARIAYPAIASVSTSLTGLAGIAGVGLTSAGVAAAGAMGYLTGELINQIPAVEAAQQALGEAIITNDALAQSVLGSDGHFLIWNVTAWETAEVSEELAKKWRMAGIELDEFGAPTERGIEQLKNLNRGLYNEVDAINAVKRAQENAKSAANDYAGKKLDVESANLRVEAAEKRYQDAVATSGESSYDSRVAHNELERAKRNAETATDDLKTSEVEYASSQEAERRAYQNRDAFNAMRDSAANAARQIERMLAAGQAVRSGGNVYARSSSGGYNIPVYGSGGFVGSKHLAVVGDKPEVIIPLGDKSAAARLLPMLLNSLPSGQVSGMASSMSRSVSGEMSRLSGSLGGTVTVGAGAVQIHVTASPGTTQAEAAGAGEAAARAFLARIARERAAL